MISINNEKMTPMIGRVFGGVGLLLLIVSISVYFYKSKSLEGTVLIKGKVVEITSSGTPKVEFELNNQTYQIYGSVSSKPPAFDIDEEVELFVNPKSPQTASIDSFMENWFLVLGLGFMGTIFAAIGIGIVMNTLKKKGVA